MENEMSGRRLVVGALMTRGPHPFVQVLAARRSTSPVGRWEFPGGKAEAGESSQDALVREIREELSVIVEVGKRLDPTEGARWPISDSLEMELWWCTTVDEPQPGDSHDELRWLTADELWSVDWLDADRDALSVVSASIAGPR